MVGGGILGYLMPSRAQGHTTTKKVGQKVELGRIESVARKLPTCRVSLPNGDEVRACVAGSIRCTGEAPKCRFLEFLVTR
jgi:hypothetical protein